MKKHEVLSLLERFPELVDSDDLATDLLRQANDETGEDCYKLSDTVTSAIRREPAESPPARPR